MEMGVRKFDEEVILQKSNFKYPGKKFPGFSLTTTG